MVSRSERSARAPAHVEKENDRTELQAAEHADRDPAVGDLEHEQDEGDVRQPVAGVRDQLADEEQPVVAVPERNKRLAQCPRHPGAAAAARQSLRARPAPRDPSCVSDTPLMERAEGLPMEAHLKITALLSCEMLDMTLFQDGVRPAAR